jgi:hypothetical protein
MGGPPGLARAAAPRPRPRSPLVRPSLHVAARTLPLMCAPLAPLLGASGCRRTTAAAVARRLTPLCSGRAATGEIVARCSSPLGRRRRVRRVGFLLRCTVVVTTVEKRTTSPRSAPSRPSACGAAAPTTSPGSASSPRPRVPLLLLRAGPLARSALALLRLADVATTPCEHPRPPARVRTAVPGAMSSLG